MFDQISRLLMTISNYMDYTESITKNLILIANPEETNTLLKGIENRERVIKIIGKFNLKLEMSLSKIPPQELKVLNQVLLRHWNTDLERWKQRMELLDESLAQTIQSLKQKTQQEIRSTFDTKNKIVGYNLRNTK